MKAAMKKVFASSLAAFALSSLPAAALAAGVTAAPAAAPKPAAAPASPALRAGHGHDHGRAPGDGAGLSPEDKARQETLNAMSEARLQGLAAYLRALVDGERDAVALEKAKVSIMELDRLAFLSERYYPARAKALDFEDALARLRATPAKGLTPAAQKARTAEERALAQKLVAHERFRGQFFGQVKPESRALIDKYEATFVAIVRDQWARRERLKAEALTVARARFDAQSLPRFVTYLKARADLKSEKEALAAAGLDEQQALGLSQLATEYCREKLTAQKAEQELPAARARLSEAKARGKSTSFEARLIQHYEGQLAQFAAFQQAFAQENGAPMREAIEANLEALLATYQHHAEAPRDDAR